MATNDDDDVGAAAARPAAAAHQDLICRLLEEGRAPPRRAAEEVDRRVLARSSGRINGISDDAPTIRVAAWMITAIRTSNMNVSNKVLRYEIEEVINYDCMPTCLSRED
uniref:Uncharacterized protein n=1 Tax=Oryza sativa subsp. japonica TaxID=39947 RepID=Q5Z4N0_ORYSJ|nr:hypothetical protein [Oryza sativa Japonica Group]